MFDFWSSWKLSLVFIYCPISDTINCCLAIVMGKYEDAFNFLYNHEALMYYIHFLINFVCES